MPVTSTMIMSMHTEPTMGTRRPRTSTDAAIRQARVEPVGIAGRDDRDRRGRVVVHASP